MRIRIVAIDEEYELSKFIDIPILPPKDCVIFTDTIFSIEESIEFLSQYDTRVNLLCRNDKEIMHQGLLENDGISSITLGQDENGFYYEIYNMPEREKESVAEYVERFLKDHLSIAPKP